ncbi:hypothetical protein [Haloferula sp.]|uniref:hypothetical protein n=1 Tax=Haloferula sp. TaxID=2497595 RepID=UPI003C780BE6
MRTCIPTITLILGLFSPVMAQPSSEPGELLFIENDKIKVGIDRSKGASITWLSWKDYPGNVVNIHDPGRLIQQSYYAGRSLDRQADGQSKSWSPWSWNPIQGGGVGSWARVSRFEKIDGVTLYGETIPKLWDMPDEEAEATMEQWTGFEPNMPDVVVVRNRLVSKRQPGDRWGPAKHSPQEVPACYFTRNFDQFMVYLGGGQWKTVEQKVGPPWGKARPPLRAMACFNAEGQGIAVFSPSSGESWNFGPHVATMSDDPQGGPCVHIAPVSRVHLGPRSTYEYRYWLIVGDRESITARLDSLWALYSKERGKLTNSSDPSAN